MHYHAEIWVPDDVTNVEEYVAEQMAPHREEYEEGSDELRGFWDWYQIGGRWTGTHDPEYDPSKDERNIEECWLCHGTGKRTDMDVANGCNGCRGTGQKEKWPTDWAPFMGDVIAASQAADDLSCYTLIVSGEAYHIEEWDGETFVKTDFDGLVKPKLDALGINDGRLVTVDYHS